MTASSDWAAAVDGPVASWLSDAEPFACDTLQQELDGRAQPSEWRGSRQTSHGYALQTQPWAVRFHDHQLEEYFQSRRAAGKLKASCRRCRRCTGQPMPVCGMHPCCSSNDETIATSPWDLVPAHSMHSRAAMTS